MARPLNNKALTVLALLREGGERTCKDIAQIIHDATPCGHCNGTGEGDDSRCGRCYGRGLAPFGYSDAYVALEQLRKRRLARRRHLLDEWGDATRTLVYEAINEGDPDDPLEALFTAPTLDDAERNPTAAS